MRHVILLIAVLATPAASAGWFGPSVVDLAPYRVGDVLRYDKGNGAETASFLVRYEGASHAVDAFGRDRETVAFRVEHSNATGLVRSQVCHFGPDGRELVRADILAGGGGGSWSWSSDSSLGSLELERKSVGYEERVIAHFGSCDWWPATRTSFAEGDRVALLDLIPGQSVENTLSAPGRVGDFHGHEALEFDFDLEPGVVGTVVVSEGFPALVEVVGKSEGEEVVLVELVGFRSGEGPAFVPAPPGDLAPPRFAARSYERLVLDDAAFAPDYPFADAMAALAADPYTGFKAWVDEHPDAVVSIAYYSRGATHGTEPPGTTSDGVWYIVLAEGTAFEGWSTYRSRVPDAPAVPLAGVPDPRVRNYRVEAPVGGLPHPVRADAGDVVTSAEVARVAAAHGVPTDRVVLVGYNLYVDADGTPKGYYSVADVSAAGEGAEDGHEVWISAQTGEASGVASTSKRMEASGLLALAPDRGSLVSAGSGGGVLDVASGAGLAAGTLTGAALLALVLKFLLLPLYTRLRRDRLLDNPVRSRLYEAVRRDAGIHQADLVDLAGIGKGATKHHLDQLVRHRLLVALESDGFTRYFAAGEVPPDVARREAVLRAGSLRAVYEVYATEPALSLREAGARLGMSAPSVYRARRKLAAAGLLPAALPAEVRS